MDAVASASTPRSSGPLPAHAYDINNSAAKSWSATIPALPSGGLSPYMQSSAPYVPYSPLSSLLSPQFLGLSRIPTGTTPLSMPLSAPTRRTPYSGPMPTPTGTIAELPNDFTHPALITGQRYTYTQPMEFLASPSAGPMSQAMQMQQMQMHQVQPQLQQMQQVQPQLQQMQMQPQLQQIPALQMYQQMATPGQPSSYLGMQMELPAKTLKTEQPALEPESDVEVDQDSESSADRSESVENSDSEDKEDQDVDVKKPKKAKKAEKAEKPKKAEKSKNASKSSKAEKNVKTEPKVKRGRGRPRKTEKPVEAAAAIHSDIAELRKEHKIKVATKISDALRTNAPSYEANLAWLSALGRDCTDIRRIVLPLIHQLRELLESQAMIPEFKPFYDPDSPLSLEEMKRLYPKAPVEDRDNVAVVHGILQMMETKRKAIRQFLWNIDRVHVINATIRGLCRFGKQRGLDQWLIDEKGRIRPEIMSPYLKPVVIDVGTLTYETPAAKFQSEHMDETGKVTFKKSKKDWKAQQKAFEEIAVRTAKKDARRAKIIDAGYAADDEMEGKHADLESTIRQLTSVMEPATRFYTLVHPNPNSAAPPTTSAAATMMTAMNHLHAARAALHDSQVAYKAQMEAERHVDVATRARMAVVNANMAYATQRAQNVQTQPAQTQTQTPTHVAETTQGDIVMSTRPTFTFGTALVKPNLSTLLRSRNSSSSSTSSSTAISPVLPLQSVDSFPPAASTGTGKRKRDESVEPDKPPKVQKVQPNSSASERTTSRVAHTVPSAAESKAKSQVVAETVPATKVSKASKAPKVFVSTLPAGSFPKQTTAAPLVPYMSQYDF